MCDYHIFLRLNSINIKKPGGSNIMKTKSIITLSFGLAIIIFTACQQAPQNELDLARSAVDSAKTAEANRYLAADFQAIQDSLNSAQASIEEQNSKTAFARKYDESKRILAVVTTMANEAVTKTQIRREELKAQNQVLLNEVKIMLEENKALVLKAPKGKEGKEAHNLIQQDLSAIEATVTEAESLITTGDILSANDKLTVSKQKAVSINEELNNAIAKASGGKK